MPALPENLAVPIDNAALERFCERWKITRLEVFGSALRQDFNRESDVDFLVTHSADSRWTLFDSITMKDELAALVGRDVDIVSRPAIEQSKNWIRKKEILGTAVPLYVAR